MMLIRPVDLRDPAVCRAAWRLQREAYEIEASIIGSRGMQALNETEEDLAGNASEEFAGCFVTEAGTDRLVGVIATEPGPSVALAPIRPVRWISRLAVDPALMRRGIGRALVRHVIVRAFSEPLCVSTGAANAPARRLYESVGFAVVEKRAAPDGTALVVLLHRRTVAS